MIEIKNVSKQFNNIELFEDVNVVIPCGKKVLLRGANGSGKSVLLKMIVGFSKPNSGQIIVDNNIIGVDCDFIQNAGVSINAPEFINNISGYENLIELAKIRKITSKEEILELCKEFGLDKDIHKKYSKYSLGMKQKMRLIQALMEKPKYLILDEPFDALDKISKCKLENILNKYIQENNDSYLIYTSHSQESELFADIIYEIEDKRIKMMTK